MSVAPVFVLTSPSLTDMSDSVNLAEARARFYAAELQGDIALADWARAYAPPLLQLADDAPNEDAISAAEEEASREAKSAHANEIHELLITAEPAFKVIADLQVQLNKIVADEKAA